MYGVWNIRMSGITHTRAEWVYRVGMSNIGGREGVYIHILKKGEGQRGEPILPPSWD